MKVSFQLTMPNVGSWNGKWTGAAKKYYLVKSAFKGRSGYGTVDANKAMELLGENQSRSFYYNFGDGWGANVKMEIVDAAEARKRTKESAGFCGYEWMIDSIMKHGKITADGALA
jgi:hypothetical protein